MQQLFVVYVAYYRLGRCLVDQYNIGCIVARIGIEMSFKKNTSARKTNFHLCKLWGYVRRRSAVSVNFKPYTLDSKS